MHGRDHEEHSQIDLGYGNLYYCHQDVKRDRVIPPLISRPPRPWRCRPPRPQQAPRRQSSLAKHITAEPRFSWNSSSGKMYLRSIITGGRRVRTSRNETQFTVLSLATKRSWKDRDSDERLSQTTWHRCIAWGKLAEFASTLNKGSHVQVKGEIRTRQYTQKTGSKRSTEVKKVDHRGPRVLHRPPGPAEER